MGGVPDIPLAVTASIALMSKDVFAAVYRLIDVELECLGGVRVVKIEEQVVAKVAGGRLHAELLPPQSGGVGIVAANPNLGRSHDCPMPEPLCGDTPRAERWPD